MTDAVVAYKRQILQRIRDPPLPPGKVLRDDDVQKWLARDIFNDEVAEELGPIYLKQQLDRVTGSIENAITDPQEQVRCPSKSCHDAQRCAGGLQLYTYQKTNPRSGFGLRRLCLEAA